MPPHAQNGATMTGQARITDAQRRARLVDRHHLARSALDVEEAVRGVVAVHSSDPVTPYLALWARVSGFSTQALDEALYRARSLWRLHAMRRTLFVVQAAEGPIFQAGVGREIARKERDKVERWLAAEMPAAHVPGWLADVQARTLDVLAEGGQWRTQDLTAAVDELGTEITLGTGRWATRSPLSSRLLFLLAMDGHIVRAQPAGTWRSSQYHWVAAGTWFGRVDRLDAATGRTMLARHYLASYGPVTLTDLRWWTGWTARQATAAVRDLGAVAVQLDAEGRGYVLADDAGAVAEQPPHVALLPGLDPTAMGWKERSWYLPPAHTRALFDRNGNAGPTVWVDGHIVGGWAQRPDGAVTYRLLEDIGRGGAARVAEEAAALTAWLQGQAVVPRFRTPLERELAV